MRTIKPSAIVASLVVGIAAVVGMTSVGVSQVAKPKTAQQATDVPADKSARRPGPRRPHAQTAAAPLTRPAATSTSMRRPPPSTCRRTPARCA